MIAVNRSIVVAIIISLDVVGGHFVFPSQLLPTLSYKGNNIRNLTVHSSMKCQHCGHIMFFTRTTDRASGMEEQVFKCSFCGLTYQESRPNTQIQRD